MFSNNSVPLLRGLLLPLRSVRILSLYFGVLFIRFCYILLLLNFVIVRYKLNLTNSIYWQNVCLSHIIYSPRPQIVEMIKYKQTSITWLRSISFAILYLNMLLCYNVLELTFGRLCAVWTRRLDACVRAIRRLRHRGRWHVLFIVNYNLFKCCDLIDVRKISQRFVCWAQCYIMYRRNCNSLTSSRFC